MEENQYRDTYHSINPLRCAFEKSINSRRCNCSLSERFNLADREGVRCTIDLAQKRCLVLLETLRNNASFTMRLTRIDGVLPHGKEMKVQVGGLLGLQRLLDLMPDEQGGIQDIHRLISQAIEKYTSMDQFPFDEIVKQIASFEGRGKRARSTK